MYGHTDRQVDGWTDRRTDVQNFSPFYKTLSPVGAAAQKTDRQIGGWRKREREERKKVGREKPREVERERTSCHKAS